MANLDTPLVDNGAVLDAIFARWRLPCLSAGLEVGIYEALAESPASADELAKQLRLDPRAVHAVLPVLAASGILKVREGRFSLTTAARTYLLEDSYFFFGATLRSQARSSFEHGELVKHLRPKKEKHRWWYPRNPVDAWETGKLSRKMAKEIAAYMQAECAGLAAGAAASDVFRGTNRLLDVGGGSGALAVAIAAHQPGTECTVMDLPAMCKEARRYIDAAGFGHRVTVRPVEMFHQRWPHGHDGIVFSNIFHDWSFETCVRLATLAFEALPSGGKVFVHEMLMDDDHGGPAATAGFGVQMLIDTRGRQYTFPEIAEILEKAGFTNVGVTRSFGYYSVVTAGKP
jgi:O-methyltransferase domain/Dimerisation domain